MTRRRHRQAPDRVALIERAMGLRAILDQLDIAAVTCGSDGIHIAWPAGEMHADDGLRVGTDRVLDSGRVDILAICADIHKAGSRACVGDNGCRCYETAWRDDDFICAVSAISCPNAKTGKAKLQRHGAIRNSNGVVCPAPGCEDVLEFPGDRSCPVIHFARSQNRGNRLDLLFGIVWPWGCRDALHSFMVRALGM